MMTSNRPDISIVTISYNGLDDTARMIRSVQRVVKSVSYEIIVVDNASTHDEAAALAAEFGRGIITIRSEKNLGFSGGNNLGILRATGRYVMLLNNDTYIETDGLGLMVDMMDADSRIGAVSPKIRFASGERPIQFAGFTPLSDITMRNSITGYLEPDCGQCDTPREIPYAHGPAMMVRREAIRDAGMMPEVYFLYYEEIDWSISIREAGYTIWYQPACTIFHEDGQTGGGVSAMRTYYLTRNRLLLAWRKKQGGAKVASLVYQMGVAAPKNAALHLLKGSPHAALATLKACGGFCRMRNKGK